MKKKPIINAKVMNKIIKGMTKRQNDKKKLNAGEKREAANGVIFSMIEDLSSAEKLHLIETLSK